MSLKPVYRNAFTEVYTILNYLDYEDYKKIPKEVIEVIEENMNPEYVYEMNEEIDLFNQPMLPETKAILFNFFRDYWATNNQREKIIKMHREEILKAEIKKKENYKNIDIFYNKKPEKASDKREKSLIKQNKNIFKKIFDFIKSITNR